MVGLWRPIFRLFHVFYKIAARREDVNGMFINILLSITVICRNLSGKDMGVVCHATSFCHARLLLLLLFSAYRLLLLSSPGDAASAAPTTIARCSVPWPV